MPRPPPTQVLPDLAVYEANNVLSGCQDTLAGTGERGCRSLCKVPPGHLGAPALHSRARARVTPAGGAIPETSRPTPQPLLGHCPMLSQHRIGYAHCQDVVFPTPDPPGEAIHLALPPCRNFLHGLEDFAGLEVRAESAYNFAK